MSELGYRYEDRVTVPLEDVNLRRFGFRITIDKTSHEYWTTISGCKNSPWTEAMGTSEGRQWIASHDLGPILWEREDPRSLGNVVGEPWPSNLGP